MLLLYCCAALLFNLYGGQKQLFKQLFLSRGAKIALYLSFICPFQFFLSSLLLVFGESRSNYLFHSTTTFALFSSILTSLFSLKFYFNTVSTLLFDFYSFYFENFTQGSQKREKLAKNIRFLSFFLAALSNRIITPSPVMIYSITVYSLLYRQSKPVFSFFYLNKRLKRFS